MQTKVAPCVTPFSGKSKEGMKRSQKGRGISEDPRHIKIPE